MYGNDGLVTNEMKIKAHLISGCHKNLDSSSIHLNLELIKTDM